MLFIFPLCLVLGFFLPGCFVARYFRHGLWGATAFVISLLILFYSVFWLGIFGVAITLWHVLPCLAAAAFAGAWLRRRSFQDDTHNPIPWAMQDWILMTAAAVVG